MKMIRLEGMLLKKLFLILFLMSAAMVLILPLLIAYVPVDPQYLIAAAIFVLLLAAEMLKRALYVGPHQRLESFMPVNVRWHIGFQSALILAQAVWIALLIKAICLCSDIALDAEGMLRCGLLSAAFILAQLSWMMNAYLHITNSFIFMNAAIIGDVWILTYEMNASFCLGVILMALEAGFVLAAMVRSFRR